jgi:hypothetical protein
MAGSRPRNKSGGGPAMTSLVGGRKVNRNRTAWSKSGHDGAVNGGVRQSSSLQPRQEPERVAAGDRLEVVGLEAVLG